MRQDLCGRYEPAFLFSPMSAPGQKQTSLLIAIDVCFAPENGHCRSPRRSSVLCQFLPVIDGAVARPTCPRKALSGFVPVGFLVIDIKHRLSRSK